MAERNSERIKIAQSAKMGRNEIYHAKMKSEQISLANISNNGGVMKI